MIDDENSGQLSEGCFSICEALKTAVQGKNADDLNESVKMALEDSKRCVDWSWPCPLPYQATPGLHAKSNGLSRRERTRHTLRITRAGFKGASWKFKRYSALSTHRAHAWVNVSPT
jgi:hypothetical protein